MVDADSITGSEHLCTSREIPESAVCVWRESVAGCFYPVIESVVLSFQESQHLSPSFPQSVCSVSFQLIQWVLSARVILMSDTLRFHRPVTSEVPSPPPPAPLSVRMIPEFRVARAKSFRETARRLLFLKWWI